MRVIYSCSDIGLGHVSRTLRLGKRLIENGHEVYFYSGGKAYDTLKSEFSNTQRCTQVIWYENAHGILTSASLLNILLPLPHFNLEENKLEIKKSNAIETIHRYYDLRRDVLKIKPDVLVSDGDIHALRLAHRWHVPAVYITNLIRPSYGFSALLSPGQRFTERYIKPCSKIVIPDNPPPTTVCEYNLGNLDHVGISEKVVFAGSFLDMTADDGLDEYIFAPISGPPGTRLKLVKALLPLLKDGNAEATVSLGIPGERKMVKVGKCKVYSWLSPQERQVCMKNARVIIFSGGHTTCFETIKYAKPSICFPTQPEQAANAAKLQELGCSIMVRSHKHLAQALTQVEQYHERFKKQAKTLREASGQLQGVANAVKVIEETAK